MLVYVSGSVCVNPSQAFCCRHACTSAKVASRSCRGVYTSAANSVQSGAAQLATLRCISLKAERSRAALSTLAKKGPSTTKKGPSTKSPLAASAQGALHQGLNIKVRPSGAEQHSGERLFGCLNDRSSHFVGISVRRGPSVLQPSYPAVCMRRHRNADRSPSV